MPRYSEPESTTPFAQVLLDYMWNERPRNRPPMGVAQLAIRVGASKQNVNNWIFRGSVPPLENVLIILAKLDIPLRRLYDAYKSAGLTVPRFDASDHTPPIISESSPSLQPGLGRKRQTKVPVSDTVSDTVSDAPEPRPYTPPPLLDPAQEVAEEWDTLIKQTSAALRAEGLPQASVDAVVRSLRARQAGQTTAERQIQAEHTEHQEGQETQDHEPSEPSEPQSRETRETKRRGQPTAK